MTHNYCKIAIDARMSSHTGIGRYIRELLLALSKINNPYQFKLIGDALALKNFPDSFQKTASSAAVYSFQEQWMIPCAAKSANGLHVPHYNAPLLWGKKLVVTVHDLIHLHFPRFLPSKSAYY